jgi:hypothetical protein
VDYVLDVAPQLIPIEVKWSDKPRLVDAQHLIKFMQEYPATPMSYIVCRTPRRYKFPKIDNVTVIPRQEINVIFEGIAK